MDRAYAVQPENAVHSMVRCIGTSEEAVAVAVTVTVAAAGEGATSSDRKRKLSVPRDGGIISSSGGSCSV